MNKRNLVMAVIAVLVVGYAAGTAVVVPEGGEAQLTGEVEFNSGDVVAEFWAKNASDYFAKNAHDALQVLEESGGDLTSVASKYGHYSMGDKGELSFIVKATGTVTEVKDKLRSGYMLVKPDGYEGSKVFRLQIGPVFKGSAVRDTIDLINYKDYKNQIEWAEVSKALHDKVLSDIIAPVKPGELAGKKIEFIGCFTVGSQPDTLHITPVSIKVLE